MLIWGCIAVSAVLSSVAFAHGSRVRRGIRQEQIVVLNLKTVTNPVETLDELKALVTNDSEHHRILHTYLIGERIFAGFSFGNSNENIVGELRDRPEVLLVEPNSWLVLCSVCDTESTKSNGGDLWGLSRINHRQKGSNDATYRYETNAGQDVYVYVVDSGIDVENPDFTGRAIWGADVTHRETPKTKLDVNGHGTRIASIIGSKTFGVAKSSTLVAVKVGDANFDGYNFNSVKNDDVIAGLVWIWDHHMNRSSGNTSKTKSVVNIGATLAKHSAALEEAVKAVVQLNIPVVVAVGNENADASHHSPSKNSTIRVGAMDRKDSLWSQSPNVGSNFGSAVDILAPGENIWGLGLHGPQLMNGTSSSAAFVSGVIARFMTNITHEIHPLEIEDWLLSTATRGAIDIKGKVGTANRLLFMDCDGPDVTTMAPSSLSTTSRHNVTTVVPDTTTTPSNENTTTTSNSDVTTTSTSVNTTSNIVTTTTSQVITSSSNVYTTANKNITTSPSSTVFSTPKINVTTTIPGNMTTAPNINVTTAIPGNMTTSPKINVTTTIFSSSSTTKVPPPTTPSVASSYNSKTVSLSLLCYLTILLLR